MLPPIEETFPFITLSATAFPEPFYIHHKAIEVFRSGDMGTRVRIGGEWYLVKETAAELIAKVRVARQFGDYLDQNLSAEKAYTGPWVSQTSPAVDTAPPNTREEETAPDKNKRK